MCRRARVGFEVAERVGDEEATLELMMSLGATELCLCADERGWVRLDDALRRARAAGLGETASVCEPHGRLPIGQQDPRVALPLAQDALEVAINLGLESGERFLRAVAAGSLIDAGDSTKRSRPRDRSRRRPTLQTRSCCNRSGCWLVLPQYGESHSRRGRLDDLDARARQWDDRWLYTWAAAPRRGRLPPRRPRPRRLVGTTGLRIWG